LFAYLEKKPKKSKKLFDENTAFWILLSLKKIPEPCKKAKLIWLPHSFNDDTEICLFSKLPGKQMKEKLKEIGVTNVAKVISLAKLRKEYKSFEQKRTLCSQYEVFLCDDNIYHRLVKFLGKSFLSRKKEPTPVRLGKTNVKKQIDRAIGSTRIRFGQGSCSAVKVGHSGQTQEQLIENVIAAVSKIAKKVPRGWNNIQSIHLKTSESVALPLYNSLPDVENVIDAPEPPLKKRKKI